MSKEYFILAITGPAGSGKTTVGEKLAKQLDRCVNIDADHIKHFIPSGFRKIKKTNGSDDWEYTEWGLVGDSIGLLAMNFRNKGFNIIINGYVNKRAWEAIQKHVDLTHKVLLLPSAKIVSGRDRSRPEDVRMGNEAIETHHAYFSTDQYFNDFTRLDTSNHNVKTTANAVLALIKK